MHDEFSYLLAADTFAGGRLTNPQHPHWKHFESFQIFHEPTYQSKYPPAQAAFMALGQWATGQPMAGVHLSSALMCLAVCWMLFAWLPPFHALLGGLLMVLQVGLISYWSQTYWGGAVAATGGALLFGGLRRVIQQARIRDSLWIGCGLLLLAHSRPFEGLLAALSAAVVLFGWARPRVAKRKIAELARILVPLGLALAVIVLTTCIYNHRLTGSSLTLPHIHYHSIYNPEPLGIMWQAGDTTRRELAPNWHPSWRSRAAGARVHAIDLLGSWVLLIGIGFTPALALLLAALRRRWMRFALMVSVLVALGTLLSLFSPPHYIAPVTGLIIVLLMDCVRRVGCFRHSGRRVGRLLVALMFLVCSVDRGVDLARGRFFNQRDRMGARTELIERLVQAGGRHLVFVRYGPEHNLHQEWVYNGAFIDRQDVVFARSLDPVSDQRLRLYFADRAAWLLEFDERTDEPRLSRF